jgi:hypothetical protein
MQRPLRTSRRRSPETVSFALRRDAACARMLVACALVISIFTLLYLLSVDVPVA